MKSKQVSIVLEQIQQERNYQTFDKGPHDVGEGPWMRVEKLPTEYLVIQMRNACVLDLGGRGPNDLRTVRVGDRLTEPQAEELARMRAFDVTVRR